MGFQSPSEGNESLAINRRRLLQSLGAASAVGLAGCSDGDNENDDDGRDDDGDEELGERVPEVVIEYWTGYGGHTTIQENMSPPLQNSIEDAIGVDVEISAVEFSQSLDNMWQDLRTAHFYNHWLTNSADRLDPHEITRWWAIDWAGGNGRANSMNYASCEYSEYALGQARAETEEEREQQLARAQEIISHDCMPINLTPVPLFGAWRTDEVDIQAVGAGGVSRTNPQVFIQSISGDRDQIVVGIDPTVTESRNFPTVEQGVSESFYQQLIHSPLIGYNEDYELEPVLAEDWEVIDAKNVSVTLRDDITFHNGDPITPEDVKFTFEQLVRGAEAGVYSRPTIHPYDEIAITDDRTVEFSFTEPNLPFISVSLTRWGIWHKETFEQGGAVENPGDFEFDPPVGSGPFQITDFESGSHIRTEPFDDHPTYSPDSGIFWNAYRSEETSVQALEANEVQILPDISPGTAFRLAEESADTIDVDFSEGFMTYMLAPQHPIAPTKFEEFRKAVAASINRQDIVDIAFRGEIEPLVHASYLSHTHPDRIDDEDLYKMADPQGEPDKAREILEDAGWGWDDDGNLHYPPDADLNPLWPEGEEPDPENFPCLEDI